MPDTSHILVVDDEESIRFAFTRYFQSRGHRVSSAATAGQALAAYQHDRPDVVFLDVRLPDASGLDVLEKLRADDPNATVIVMTAYGTLETVTRAIRGKAFDYLVKPYDALDKVLSTVARAVARRRERQREAGLLPTRTKSIVSTGNSEIDMKMGGGIPVGSLTLIDGHSHSGKSVLAQQWVWGSVREGCRVSYFSTENTVKSLVRQMQSLNIDILDYLLLRWLRVYPMEVANTQGDALKALAMALRAEQIRGADIVLIDALTPFILSRPDEEVIGFFEGCKRLCSEGVTIVNVVHSHAIASDLLVRLTSLCDAHLTLRTEQVGPKLVKVMEVAKVRGASRNTGNIVSFEVEPGLGMRMIPLSKAQG